MNELDEVKKIYHAEKLERDDDQVNLGEWYWFRLDNEHHIREHAVDSAPEGYHTLGCITHVGSNYVQITEPDRKYHGKISGRVHFDDIPKELLYEPKHREVLQGLVNSYKNKANDLLSEIKTVTAQLGVSNEYLAQESSETALAVQSSSNVNDYKKSLLIAEKETLPELFNQMEYNNSHLVKWLGAEALEIEALMSTSTSSLSKIRTRIDNVSLYAGLTEEITCIKEGSPGKVQDKVHLMQRKLYMDEESLIAHSTDGMRFKDIYEFESWLGEEPNFSRCLPFDKCIVCFEVRRENYPTGEVQSLMDAIIQTELRELDNVTLMYIRNGEQLHRLQTEIKFGDLIFPSKDIYDPQEEWMVHRQVSSRMRRSEYDVLKEEDDIQKENEKQWYIDNPYVGWFKKEYDRDPSEKDLSEYERGFNDYRYKRDNPFTSGYNFSGSDNWKPLNSSNVKYDDYMQELQSEIDQYNRIALIVQGILDRSEVLHPHPPVQSWKQNSFEAMVKLIYDGDNVLNYGDAPSFHEYKEACNSLSTIDSVFYGQNKFWSMYLREKCEEKRSYYESSWKHSERIHKAFDGNPGPDKIGKAFKVTKTGKIYFEWMRDSKKSAEGCDRWDDKPKVRDTITVPLNELFNISAYKLGDFKKFFNDPRTRASYLKWAPMLLEAEKYHKENKC